MSIQSEIDRISGNVASTYTALSEEGADMPAEQNSDNLPETARSIRSVKFTEQTLTSAQKTQARTNIGAASDDELGWLSKQIADHKDDTDIHVTSTEKQTWNNKSDFSGNYNDLSNKPTIPSKASDVGADASGTAESKVSAHNTSESSHNDIRLLIEGLTNRLNALANSDDTTLDQMAEIVAYIKNNKSLIDGVTTNKVNVSDIIDNLTTSVSNKPLSAKQGVQLKALIDKCLTSIPSEYITETELDAKGYLTSHQDISGKADKSNAETWTFTLKDGSTVTKKVVLA